MKTYKIYTDDPQTGYPSQQCCDIVQCDDGGHYSGGHWMSPALEDMESSEDIDRWWSDVPEHIIFLNNIQRLKHP